MTAAALDEGAVRVSVHDADTIVGVRHSTQVIGTYAFDFESLWARPKHELYRQWLALEGRGQDADCAGYLKLSATIMGPGDGPPPHDAKEDARLEALERAKLGGVLLPPRVKRELSFVVLSVHRAEGLPAMDTNLLGVRDGIDMQVARVAPLKCFLFLYPSAEGTKKSSPSANSS